MKKISIIIPFYNEKENIPKIYNELIQVMKEKLSKYKFEIILMDNHSTDGSFDIAMSIADKDHSVKAIRLSRNFGYQANIQAGYAASFGDAIIQLDVDGEDDPAFIPLMINLWEKGNKVVYGIRKKRIESRLITMQRKFFYRIINWLSSISLPVDAGDFRLLDRVVVEKFINMKEFHLYIRGMVSYIGFQQTGFEYERRPRYAGESKFRWKDYVQLAWDGIISFSSKPLILASWFGFILSILSFLGIVIYFIIFLKTGRDTPGFFTLIFVILFSTGVQSIFIGILGMYVGKIFEEVKNRPHSFIEQTYPENLKLKK